MRCPSCGTLVREGTSVCPACHATITTDAIEPSEDVRWCVSCGSAIPEDEDTCPVCGMPAGGEFEEDGVEEKPQSVDVAEGLASAVPPMPQEGDEDGELIKDAPRRMRMVVTAVLAALVVVGGTTLYITRPWDPQAYSTHATEDADTSMEGFPGEVAHLSAQDRSAEAEQKEYEKKASKVMDGFFVRMGEMSGDADTLYQDLTTYFNTRDADGVAEKAASASALLEELDTTTKEIEGYTLEDDDLKSQRESILMLSSYLRGVLDTLNNAWAAAAESGAANGAADDAYAAFQWGSNGKSYDEWRTLFVNAYKDANA